MLPTRYSTILEKRDIPLEELIYHQISKKRGIHYYNILKRKTIVQLRSTNEILKDLPRNEFIEQYAPYLLIL